MTANQLIGIGLRYPHYKQVIAENPPVGWFEVHSENFFARGGNAVEALTTIAQRYPISLHGIGLSLGSAAGISTDHLQQLARLIELTNPFLVSEHLSWGYVAGKYMPDLLHIAYTPESLEIFVRNINAAQDFLQREILIENPSSYIEYKVSSYQEADFLAEICSRTGAKILLDVNNIFVAASNHDWDADEYIASIPVGMVKEIHLAGHSIKPLSSGRKLRVDTHNDYVCPEVWRLYDLAIKRFGAVYTLLEWDADIPTLEVLMKEASKAALFLPQKQEVEGE